MAKSNVIVQLGYEDEIINEKYKDQVNFTTNKLGGQPVSNSRNTQSFIMPGSCSLVSVLGRYIIVPTII